MDKGADVVITPLLAAASDGDRQALAEALSMLYDELHRLARSYMRRERQGHTLQPTALVNEAYLRLEQQHVHWRNRSHFLAVAAQLMRRILVDYARARSADKRAGADAVVELDEAIRSANDRDVNLVDLDDALVGLAKLDERLGMIVELKYFGGMTIDEIADVLDLSPPTVVRNWAVARAWLRRELTRKSEDCD